MSSSKLRVLMLCGNDQSSRIMYHGLTSDVNVVCVILESSPPTKKIIKRRMKRLGTLKVIGQLMFVALNKILSRAAQDRMRRLISDYKLNDAAFPEDVVKHVESINSEDVIELLNDLKPDVVVVNGTRIISKAVLSSTPVHFINTHMGITPRYRGVHGGYWALAKQDHDNCGVTVHLVDQGIDTGGVLYQDIIQTGRHDNLNTYSIHQIAKAIPLMKAALNDVRENQVTVKQGVLPSCLWYHPTLFEYLINWVGKGVK
ncbi:MULTISPECIES: formyl transferase [Chromohalobacter]|uniref:phosphoribosylglycinamide formyltransferase 1 n=1 Tax=Chromohalobacter moromii TaxID=2860329 RepID=A0A9X2X5H9_9GAMM|nr:MULTISPECIES: formyl transferase [Chromohalobacter]MCK2047154.1 formyl transferase [Chromohalobacter moromii]MCT8498593.1 formyl transferase [Chromohalobacter canadensis]MCT8506811.1 formyl transferase [Chromohalobacter moromii]